MTWLLNWNVIHFVNKRIAKLLAVTTAIKENNSFLTFHGLTSNFI